MNKISRALPKKIFDKGFAGIFGITYMILTATIIRNLMLPASWLGYSRKYQALSVVAIAPLLFFIFYLYEKRQKELKNPTRIIVGALVVCVQLIMLFTLYGETGWDSGALVNAALGTEPERSAAYFSSHPNNLLLVFFYKALFWLAGVSEGKKAFLVAAFPNILFIDGTAFLLFDTTKKIWGEKIADITGAFFLLTIGMSPWIVIPYSDFPSMFLVSLSFWGFVRFQNKEYTKVKKYIYVICQVVVMIVGYEIKPTVIVIYVAYAIWRIWAITDHNTIINKCKVISGIKLACAGGIFLCFLSIGWTTLITNQSFIPINPDARFTLTHYMMLSVNDNGGVYTEEDDQISISASNPKERQKLNLAIMKERLKKKGLSGYIKHQWNRLCQIHGEGNFCFAGEGGITFMNFDLSQHPQIRRYFYITGDRYQIYKHLMQGIWFFMLGVGCIGGIIHLIIRKESKDPYVRYYMLPIIGIILFNLLFECRSRYLITYLPFYMMFSACGLEYICKWLIVTMDRNKN